MSHHIKNRQCFYWISVLGFAMFGAICAGPTFDPPQIDSHPSPSVQSEGRKVANNVVHFAIYADDLERAKTFYRSVFGWRFSRWGLPDFYRIQTGTGDDVGIGGALQKRQDKRENKGFNGYECSISVADIEKTAAAIKQHGGKILVEPVEIPTIGMFVKFSDTEGNIAAAIQYFAARRK